MKLILFTFFLFLSTDVFSALVQWRARCNGSGCVDVYGNSRADACQLAADNKANVSSTTAAITFTHSDANDLCFGDRHTTSGSTVSNYYYAGATYIGGTECPDGYFFDADNLECAIGEPPPEPCPDNQTQLDIGDNRYCFEPIDLSEDECNAKSSDFLGTMNGQAVCDPSSKCPEGQKGGFINGVFHCATTPTGCEPGTYMWYDGASNSYICGTPNPALPVTKKPDGTPKYSFIPDINSDINSTTTRTTSTTQGENGETIETITVSTNETKTENSSAGGLGCQENLICNGDAIECAMLQLQKEASCFVSDYDPLGINDLLAADDKFAELGTLDSDNKEIDIEGMVSETGDFTETTNCPEPFSFDVMGVQFGIDVSPMCDLAGMLRWLVLMMAWLTVAYMITRSF